MDTGRDGRTGAELTPERASLVVLLVACFAHYWICRTLTSEIALDVDPINLVYGMREFNPAHHAPHPPGYLVYVWMLRGLHALVGGDPLGTVQLLARLLSTLTIPLVYGAVKILRPQDAATWAFAAILTAFQPFLLFHAVDGQTHTSEAFAAAFLLVAVLCYRRRPSIQWAVALGVLLAVGSALRPSFIVAGIGPIVWAIGFRRLPHLVAAGATSIVGAFAWLLPTVRASGGLELWRAANDALVQGVFLRVNSPLSSDSIDGFVLYSAASTTLWLSLLLVPAALAMLARRGSAKLSDAPYDEARAVALWTVAPTALFYLATFISEPGYLLGAMPSVVALTVVAASGIPNFARRRLAFMMVAVAQLVILMLPSAPPRAPIGKIPSIPELVSREAIYRAGLARIGEKVPWDARVLYVTDYPDVTFSRQLPVHHPGLHSIIIHSEYWPIFDDTTLGLVTQDDWIPVPGPSLLQPGPPTVRDVPFVYDLLVVGLVASSDLRGELRKHTDCDVGDAEEESRATVLPARTCFPNGVIEVHGQGIRFQLPEPPAAAAPEPTPP